VPETFIVGPDGVIRHKHVGPLTPEAMPGFMEKARAAGRP
jgi:cytochrome c biogenesis protein CcmG, thiol:disulfide interchange protein DsbE